MQTRGRARTEQRLATYRASHEACRSGAFGLSRLVTIAPERLKLLLGGAGSAQIPTLVDPLLRMLADEAFEDLARTLAAAPSVAAQPIPMDDPLGPPALELALADGRLEPRRIAAWLGRKGLALSQALSGTLARSFALVGRAPHGEEAALVAVLSLSHLLAEVAAASALEPGAAAVPAAAFAMLERAVLTASEDASVDGQALASRALLRTGLLLSPLRVQGAAEPLLETEINLYRTSALAVQIARGLLRRDEDLRDADAMVERIASQLLTEPDAVDAAWTEAAMELLRDLLSEAYLIMPLSPALTQMLARGLSYPLALRRMIADKQDRQMLALALVRASPPAPWAPARELLESVGEALLLRQAGAELPELSPEGTAAALATDHARGAYLAVADAAVMRLARPLDQALQAREGTDAEAEWRAGKRLFFGPGDEPLLHARAREQQAQLFVDLRAFTRRALKVRESTPGELLRAELYQPILAEAGKLREEHGGSGEALALSIASGDALAFRGEVRAVVELGLAIGRQLNTARRRLDEAAAAALAGPDGAALREAEAEAQRLGQRRMELEAQLVSGEGSPEETHAAEEELAGAARGERELRESGSARREQLLGGGLGAGIFVSYGPPAAQLEAAHPTLGAWSFAISGPLSDAAQGTARSASVRSIRAGWQHAGSGGPLAFAVTVSNAASLRLEPRVAAGISRALEDGDVDAATRAIGGIFQQLQGELLRSGARELPSFDAATRLYNEGYALSAAALDAFRSATADTFTWLHRTLEAGEVHAALRARLVLPPREELVLDLALLDGDLALAFRYAGRVQLGEHDALTEVVELCDPQGPFVQLLAAHHLPRWKA